MLDISFKPMGHIGKPHGVHGGVIMYCDGINVVSDHLFVEVDGLKVPFFINTWRRRDEHSVIIKFDGINDVDQARELSGSDVFIEDNRFDGGAPLIDRFIGYTMASGSDGETVGVITAVDTSTINALFAVRRPDGREILIPAHENLRYDIDIERRIIVVDLPEGLLDI